ncbi:36084_t:CDS:2 [Gigaspora margarita]|uniref:36084_t:CDS:1 n=1 Tax=Gigaspora margarita TaxID=4874 RepID=A0ABN7UL48_GIGMA|nr:36084_t:CDS:2 [Gigaspora margarita]
MRMEEESGHFDYGIEEQLDRKISTEQMVVDVETIKVNLSKTLMELDGYGIQNESEEGDSTLKRSETTCLRIEELPKLPSSHKKENHIANSTLIEIDPNKDSSEINMKINPNQKDEIAVPGKQPNIPKKRIRNTPNSKRSEMKEKKSFLYHNVVEISKLLEKSTSIRQKCPNRSNSPNRTIY